MNPLAYLDGYKSILGALVVLVGAVLLLFHVDQQTCLGVIGLGLSLSVVGVRHAVEKFGQPPIKLSDDRPSGFNCLPAVVLGLLLWGSAATACPCGPACQCPDCPCNRAMKDEGTGTEYDRALARVDNNLTRMEQALG